MSDEKRNLGASSSDDTSALFVTARKKQIAEQEAQRKAAEEEAKRLEAEAEVRRLEAEVADRKKKAEEEKIRLAQEEEQRRREAEIKQQQMQQQMQQQQAQMQREMQQKQAEMQKQAAQQQKAAQQKSAVSPSEQTNINSQPNGTAVAKVNPLEPIAEKFGMGGKKLPVFIGVCAGAVVAILAIVIILISVIANAGGSKQSYVQWADAMALSIDAYNQLDTKNRKQVIQAFNAIVKDGGEEYAQVKFNDIDPILSSSNDAIQTSAFTAFCDISSTDYIRYLNGDSSALPNAITTLQMNGESFKKLTYPEMSAIVVEHEKVIEEVYGVETEYNFILAAEIADSLKEMSKDELLEEGLIFKMVCSDSGVDAEETYEAVKTAIANVQG